ncbi:hypothetical protein DER44DRAFT_255946 [Fusarium oxysporum]|nr:hypothetical protein DER44DRAFT_255946 [Fusarium oxysporum]
MCSYPVTTKRPYSRQAMFNTVRVPRKCMRPQLSMGISLYVMKESRFNSCLIKMSCYA